jgi:secreted trypsin-like serine protease
VGIVSYAIECANPNYPGVFTQVINYVDWIEKVINESLPITTKPPSTSSPRPTGSMGESKYKNNAPILALLFFAIWGQHFKTTL